MYMRGVTVIDPKWLPMFCPGQCALSPPLGEPWWDDESGKIMCHVNGTFGKQAWNLPTVEVEHPKNSQKYR